MWNMELLTRLHPKIIEVVKRDKPFWDMLGYELYRDETRIHTLACVDSGQAVLELDGHSYELRSGTVFMLVPGQQMRITTARKDPLHFHSFHYFRVFIHWEGKQAKLAEGTERQHDDPAFPALAPQLHPLFHDAFRIWQDKRMGYEWKAKALFYRVLDELSKSPASSEADECDRAVARSIEFMKEHYREPISRKDLAREASLSESYLSTVFKKQVGISPVQYLNRLRLDASKRLLRTTSLTIAEIAGQAGFTDSFYFTRVFSREVGMPPSEYRKA